MQIQNMKNKLDVGYLILIILLLLLIKRKHSQFVISEPIKDIIFG